MAGIEIAQIPASLEYATLKQNEDMHASLVQSHMGAEAAKKNDLAHSQVSAAEKAEMKAGEDLDHSSGGYAGDGGSNRREKKEENKDRVVIKGSSSSFDIKV
jgi:hypothetical protein